MSKVTETNSGAAAHVQGYLRDAIDSIDAAFGAGHAAANPELVGAFIGACAQAQVALLLQHSFGDKVAGIEAGLVAIANALPLAGN